MNLEGLDHVALAVADVERSAQWYIETLGFERRYQGMWNGVPTFVGQGTTALALFPAKSDALPITQKSNGIRHLAMRADHKNFLLAQEELRERGIAFEFEDHEICHSIYFRDPDGHQLEITTYEIAASSG